MFFCAHEHKEKQETKGLVSYYQVELLDPKHRNASILNKKKYSMSPEAYQQWLLEQDDTLPQINYLDEYSRRKYLISLDSANMRLKDSENQVIDTSSYSGKKPGFAGYVIDKDDNIYIFEHKKNKLHHSSILAGGRVKCAGMIKVKKGKIVAIDNESGHYRPSPARFIKNLALFPREVFNKTSLIKIYSPWNKRFIKFLKKIIPQEQYRLRHMLSSLHSAKTYPVFKFKAKKLIKSKKDRAQKELNYQANKSAGIVSGLVISLNLGYLIGQIKLILPLANFILDSLYSKTAKEENMPSIKENLINNFIKNSI